MATRQYLHNGKIYRVCERHQPDPSKGETMEDVVDDINECILSEDGECELPISAS